ncbi:DSBA oxidoreductase [Thamnocephalis sphaerospora]|uniref:DSBA oxidoreductase n=1 Tax=Thamnocephalis sphaerospora TaxID=78915 RepID=A0A4P9XWR0_9FUNG|nr:DSBA oxidoreductase [Thamnocephalis sphaerospora]|eukprot:RKP10778.1 DSBA oxidoreductase [Thamnocephalis sphaerospora]
MAKRIINVSVTSDLLCPFCFIGKRSLEKAIRACPDLDVRVRWHPFLLDPTQTDKPEDRQERLARKFGGLERVAIMQQRLQRRGEHDGLPFQWNGEIASSLPAHQLIDYAGNAAHQGDHIKQNAVVESLFHSYFEQGKTPNDISMLLDAAEAGGLNRQDVKTYLSRGENADQVQSEAQNASRRGIRGVPHFVIEHKHVISGAQDPEAFIEALRDIASDNSTKQDASKCDANSC